MNSRGMDIRDAFFDKLYDLAKADPNLLFLTADMGAFSLVRFKKDLPKQYINVGPAEQNLVSIAAGLALGGKKVYIYAIAPFITQRCYEQVKIDLACMNLPVTLVGAGAGIAYTSDGPTHHAIQDISIMRALPGIQIFNPSDPYTAMAAAEISYQSKSPSYVRVDKGTLDFLYQKDDDFSQGLSLLKEGKDMLIVATGVMVYQALKLADRLKRHSLDVGVIDLYRIKPLNQELLLSYFSSTKSIVTLEEHLIVGGIGSLVSESLTDQQLFLPLKRIAIPDSYSSCCGDRDWMYRFYGLDLDSVSNQLLVWSRSLREDKHGVRA